MRPEDGYGYEGDYRTPYTDPESLEAVVESLFDPLTDPLPRQDQGRQEYGQGHQPRHERYHGQDQSAPWSSPSPVDEHLAPGPQAGVAEGLPRDSSIADPLTDPAFSYRRHEPAEAYTSPPDPYQGVTPEPEAFTPPRERRAPFTPAPEPTPTPTPTPRPTPRSYAGRPLAPEPDSVFSDHTMALRTTDEIGPPLQAESPVVPGEGRAARRRAQRANAEEPALSSEAAGRAARRRALRAQKPGPGVIASRVIGELFITCGVVMLLFVTYQLWWTNILAHRQANGAANTLRDEWENGSDRSAGAFSPGQGFAIMYIPKLDVKVPIAEGIDKKSVLDRGMLGHYNGGDLESAMPWAKSGNFAVAGHRNTHGEPFRYINKLVAGDSIVVETKDTFYTYEMTNRLPSTPPSNTGVIGPIPPESGFTKPGRYLTLTTCTPEFTSKYRLIVWGRMVDERPRSKGKPDALVG